MDANFVTDRIAIGGWSAAILPKQFGAVLNVAIDIDLPGGRPPREPLSFEYAKVPLHDSGENRWELLASAAIVLGCLLEKHEKVLVHCHAGWSRSVTVVCLYLVLTNKQPSLAEALVLVKRNRTGASPNPALWAIAEAARAKTPCF